MTSPPGLLSMNSICLLCRARPNWTHYYHHHYLPTHLLHHLLVLLVFLHKHVAHFLQSLCVVPNLTEHLCFSKHSPLVHYLKKRHLESRKGTTSGSCIAALLVRIQFIVHQGPVAYKLLLATGGFYWPGSL